MIEEIKDLFQSFIAPQLEGIKGDIRALDSKLDAKFETTDARISAIDTKVESFRRELLAEIRRVEEKVDLRLALMAEQIELYRKELRT